MTSPSFCTTLSERVYTTTEGCKTGFDGTSEPWAAESGIPLDPIVAAS